MRLITRTKLDNGEIAYAHHAQKLGEVKEKLYRYEDIGKPEELEHAKNALDRIYKAGYSNEVAKVRINGRLFAVRELAQ